MNHFCFVKLKSFSKVVCTGIALRFPTKSHYLQNLIVAIAQQLAGMPEEFRRLHCDYLLALQNQDGGFPGREGGSDLYYTSFALRGLVCLDALETKIIGSATQFLRARLQSSASVVDFVSLLYSATLIRYSGGPDILSEHNSDWRERVAETMEGFRTPDGGYAKSSDGTKGSTYHTFLVLLCYDLMAMHPPEPHRIAGMIRSRHREDGGYVEVAPARRGGTNPTAAAVAILLMLGDMDEDTARGAAGFVARMQSPEGGLRANVRAPVADLLSSFTGYLTLVDLYGTDQVNCSKIGSYVDSLQITSGGFRGGLWDNATDAEYTFYGLGSTALLRGSRSK